MLHPPLKVFAAYKHTKIPLLVVEYVKTSTQADHGQELHLNHLIMVMSSAAAYSASLRIRHPIIGILVHSSMVNIYAMHAILTEVCRISAVLLHNQDNLVPPGNQ
jgi:hypothetical protein